MRIRRGSRPEPNQPAGASQHGPIGLAAISPGQNVDDPVRLRIPRKRPARGTHRGAGMLAAVLGSAGLTGLLLAVPGSTAVAGASRVGIHFKGPAPVGALFTWADGKAVRHFCTATVINSRQGDLAVTAAHCVYSLKIGSFVFAPGWYKGSFPHGTWPVTAVYTDKAWQARQDPNDDFAILAVGRAGTHVQEHTGAEVLREYQTLPVQVQVIGYPDSSSEPVTCTNTGRAYDPGTLRQIKFWCGGYTDGTSGGPFLVKVSAKTGTGDVIGDIGGFQQGGDKPYISYSPQYRSGIQKLYESVNAKK